MARKYEFKKKNKKSYLNKKYDFFIFILIFSKPGMTFCSRKQQNETRCFKMFCKRCSITTNEGQM